MDSPEGWFLQQRMCRVPSLRALLVIGLLLLGILLVLVHSIHPFLARTDPVPADVLVVEGWLPDYALAEALAVFRRERYHLMVTTGEPLMRGYYLAEYRTHAELARAIMVERGAGADSIVAVPSPAVRMDRTYAAAVAVRQWFSARGPLPHAIDVFSYGSHARRSCLLFQEAFGDSVRVGVYAGFDRGYDADEWWGTSRGFQDVVMETIGLAYAAVWPPSEE